MFVSDKVSQSIKKFGQFARLSLYYVLMLLMIVFQLDVKHPLKCFRQVGEESRFAILIDDTFGEEQTADDFHYINQICFVCQIERGKGCLLKCGLNCSGYLIRHSTRCISLFSNPIASSMRYK